MSIIFDHVIEKVEAVLALRPQPYALVYVPHDVVVEEEISASRSGSVCLQNIAVLGFGPLKHIFEKIVMVDGNRTALHVGDMADHAVFHVPAIVEGIAARSVWDEPVASGLYTRSIGAGVPVG
jgi:hypothetical protein